MIGAALCLTPEIVVAQHAGHHEITVPPGAPYTRADVEFMQGMIAHHAQAIHMSRMADKHQANPRVTRLAIKIDQSQVAEIRLMQEWLVAYGQMAPDTSSWRTMKMAGMLTDAQLAELDSSNGVAFDRLFLSLMIQHHEGALDMVEALLDDPGAAEDPVLSDFASSVTADQSAEILRMQSILSAL